MIWRHWRVLVILFWAQVNILLSYRGMLLIRAGHAVLMPSVLVLAWLNVKRSPDCVFQDGDYLLYYLLMPLVVTLTNCRTVHDIPEEIRDGTLSRHLMKPFPPLWLHLMKNISGKVVQLLFLAPIITVFFLVFAGEIHWPPLSVSRLILVAAVLFLAVNLRFVLTTALAMVGFWIEHVETLHLVVNQGIWALFGGMVVPIETLPPGFKLVAALLPYRYMLSFPLEVLRGKLSFLEILAGITASFLYGLLFYAIGRRLWKKGLREYTAYGG
jgi:ABC-2 type transport system permease protein